MKHIFLIDEHLSSRQNGVGTYMELFLESLKKNNCGLNFLSFNDGEQLRVTKKDGYRYYQIPFCNRGDFLKSGSYVFPLLSLYVKDDENNIFFINHSPCADFMRALRKNFPKSKIVFTIHDQGWTSLCLGNVNLFKHIINKRAASGKNQQKERFIRNYFHNECAMYRIADAVICLNSDTYKLLQDIYSVPANKIWLIPNGIKLDIIEKDKERRKKNAKESLGISCEERVFLFVGRPTKAKGLFELLAAYDEIVLQYPNTKLVIAGGINNISECTKNIHHSASHIIYTGLISREELSLWYKAADVGVLPSYTEQCSFAGLEMMKEIGVVVSTNGWGIREMFHKGNNSIVANIPYDSESMEISFIENLKEALTKSYEITQQEKKKLTHYCEATIKGMYSEESMRIKYSELLNTL